MKCGTFAYLVLKHCYVVYEREINVEEAEMGKKYDVKVEREGKLLKVRRC